MNTRERCEYIKVLFQYKDKMMNWYVVYTKPKWEKKVAEKLMKLELNVTVH